MARQCSVTARIAALATLAWASAIVVAGHTRHAVASASPMQALRRSVYPPVKTKVNPKDGAEMIEIPAGWFTMGVAHPPPGHQDDEKPAHKV
jgi:formylglycine-generating enzyme required for sulfatase activity